MSEEFKKYNKNQKTLEWQKNNPDKANAKASRWYNKHKKEMFDKIINHYGNTCNCCGEKEIKFLTVDHINNNGAAYRRNIIGHKTLKTYKEIIEKNFPDEYQILCWNCNSGRNHYKICPHKITS